MCVDILLTSYGRPLLDAYPRQISPSHKLWLKGFVMIRPMGLSSKGWTPQKKKKERDTSAIIPKHVRYNNIWNVAGQISSYLIVLPL
jgi:hypothetical protein